MHELQEFAAGWYRLPAAIQHTIVELYPEHHLSLADNRYATTRTFEELAYIAYTGKSAGLANRLLTNPSIGTSGVHYWTLRHLAEVTTDDGYNGRTQALLAIALYQRRDDLSHEQVRQASPNALSFAAALQPGAGLTDETLTKIAACRSLYTRQLGLLSPWTAAVPKVAGWLRSAMAPLDSPAALRRAVRHASKWATNRQDPRACLALVSLAEHPELSARQRAKVTRYLPDLPAMYHPLIGDLAPPPAMRAGWEPLSAALDRIETDLEWELLFSLDVGPDCNADDFVTAVRNVLAT